MLHGVMWCSVNDLFLGEKGMLRQYVLVEVLLYLLHTKAMFTNAFCGSVLFVGINNGRLCREVF